MTNDNISTIVTPFYSLTLDSPEDRDSPVDTLDNNFYDENTISDISSEYSSDSDEDELEHPLLEYERTTEVISNTKRHKIEKAPGHLRYWDAVMILATFNTSGSIILIPWSYGQLGYIIGPITHLAIVGIVLYFNCFLIDVALSSSTKERKIRTLGDVGYTLASKFGRRLFITLQMLNMILYLPVAMETIALSFQYLSGYTFNCIGYWNIITFGILLILLQFVTKWHQASWIAYITTALAAIKAFGLLPFSFTYFEDAIKSSDEYLGLALVAGNPENNWHDLALAVSVFSYTFAPSFILIEVMSDVKDKESYKSALCTSSVIQVSFYIVAGLVGVLLWGWNVSDPVTLEIPDGSWVGFLLSAMVGIAVCLDYLIASKIVNDWARRAFFPKTWTKTVGCGGLVRHFCITLLSSGLSLGIVLAVPDLSTLVGVVTGFAVIGMNSWAVPLAHSWGGQVIKTTKVVQFMLYAAGLVCIPYTAWVIAASIYDIANADYTSGDFFCKGN